VSLREFCFSLWDQHKPKTFRQARKSLVDKLAEMAAEGGGEYETPDTTLMVYFTHWRKARGLSKPRPHRVKRKVDE
jgi:hypothetical protein